VILTEELLKRLQNYRRAQLIIPSRSEAIARLLDKALKTEGFSRAHKVVLGSKNLGCRSVVKKANYLTNNNYLAKKSKSLYVANVDRH